ncbi:MAG: hypothetical protein KatS3mg119_0929 [Rhodothalassiaceae bacterium]|nr:MAG: hypothetical protein KatS3mg119_0929 [Rhodothalassiaceae bacterium]
MGKVPKTLLIFGGIDDAHVRFVARRLRVLGVRCLFYDAVRALPVHFPITPVIGMAFNSGTITTEEIIDDEGCEKINKVIVAFYDDIEWIWIRHKKFVDLINTKEDQWLYVSSKENEALFRSLIIAYDAKSFNSLDAIFRMRSKINQIVIAMSVGFSVPETIISSNKEMIEEFMSVYRNIIVKPLSINFVPPPADGSDTFMTILTNEVKKEDFELFSDLEFSAAPSIYQRKLDKAYEVRLVAFGDECVAYKIDSQRSRRGQLDWRRAQYEAIYEQMEPTSEMHEKACAFLERSGLHYGVFDLVVDRCDRLWFLECNSDGQWAWLEPAGNGPIVQMFARQIARLMGVSEKERCSAF